MLTYSVTKQRRNYWLGKYNTPQSRELYRLVLAEWEANGRRLRPRLPAPARLARQRGVSRPVPLGPGSRHRSIRSDDPHGSAPSAASGWPSRLAAGQQQTATDSEHRH